MAGFSRFEKLLIVGGIVGAGFFGNRTYENLEGADWGSCCGDHIPTYVCDQINQNKRCAHYNFATTFLSLVLPLTYSKARREFRQIDEDKRNK